jgi:hypothetical protein
MAVPDQAICAAPIAEVMWSYAGAMSVASGPRV